MSTGITARSKRGQAPIGEALFRQIPWPSRFPNGGGRSPREIIFSAPAPAWKDYERGGIGILKEIGNLFSE
jgi:hypothetical protein